MVSLLSPARLKLAQVFLTDAIILTVQVKCGSISVDVVGWSREGHSQCQGQRSALAEATRDFPVQTELAQRVSSKIVSSPELFKPTYIS